MYSCLEHIEEAMDRCLDEEEMLPILEKLEASCSCDFCQEPAKYKIVPGKMESTY